MIQPLRILIGLAVGVGALSLAAAYSAVSWQASLGMVGIGLLWLSVLRHGNSRVANMGLFLFVAAAVWGGVQNLAWGWLLAAGLAGLAGWDLTHYLEHVQATPERRGESELVRRHLLRLAAVVVGSWLLTGLALTTTIRFNYIGALVLAGAAVILLAQAVGSLRSRGVE